MIIFVIIVLPIMGAVVYSNLVKISDMIGRIHKTKASLNAQVEANRYHIERIAEVNQCLVNLKADINLLQLQLECQPMGLIITGNPSVHYSIDLATNGCHMTYSVYEGEIKLCTEASLDDIKIFLKGYSKNKQFNS